jgi:hypothetical protein
MSKFNRPSKVLMLQLGGANRNSGEYAQDHSNICISQQQAVADNIL